MAQFAFLTLALATTAWAAGSVDSCLTAGKNSRTIVASGSWFAQQYHSVPYQPPFFQINTTKGATLAPGLIFLGTLGLSASDPSPLIIEDTGELVYVDPKVRAYNFEPQLYNGSVVLPYWSGQYSQKPAVGHGFGSITLLTDQYQKIKTLCPNLNLSTINNQKYKCEFDLHEAQLTNRNSVLGTAYNVRQADLSSIGGDENGFVFAGTVFEIDIATGATLFEWQSIDHVPVTKSKIGLTGGRGTAAFPLDYFHINSIQRVGVNYLVNSRQTWGTYLISPQGDVIWELEGGDGGDFGTLPDEATYHWAHHVRAIAQDANSMTITIFNNDNGSPINDDRPATGLTLHLPLPPGSGQVTVLNRVASDPAIFTSAEGSYQNPLADGKNQFMCYGAEPIIAEFGPDDTQLWSARFSVGKGDHSYRAFKRIFHTTPKTVPTLVVNKGDACKTAYVSWNGATDLTAWRVFSGDTASTLKKVGTVDKAGFETSFGVSGTCIQVAAMRGTTLVRRSNVACS